MAIDVRFRRTGVAAMLAGLVAACGGSSPTNPTPPGSNPGPGGSTQSCRNIVTAYTAVTTANTGFTATQSSSCTLNTTTLQGTCNQTYSDSTGVTNSWTIVGGNVYNSVADFVDEVAVIPPKQLLLSAASTMTSASGAVTAGSETYTYDAQRRLVRSQSSGGNVTTVSAWDASGRPTTARDVGPGYDNVRTIVYDNASRTRTTTLNTAPVVTIETFDANGNPLRQVASGGASVSTTEFTTTQTVRICK